ncbi:MAG: hypothetical protein U5J83_18965 [Bryobacterales bacterium]|nr:hypothetical protein [Bryobacterales bacterium]
MTPISVVEDEPTSFEFNEGQEYSPNNFGMKFSGAVTLREAMRRSLNIPAVKTAEIWRVCETSCGPPARRASSLL